MKRYICLFTCAVSRGVHIEIVNSNTTEDFLYAFRRFVARRSVPRMLVSDNASTFIGANSELKQIFEDSKIHRHFSQRNVDWKFITKRAPWHGGFWERMIGLMKSCLKKVLGRSLVSDTELYTVACEIESCLNDRPLLYVSFEPEENETLTPSHLMLGRRITAHSKLCPIDNLEGDTTFSPGSDTLAKRYSYINKLIYSFWLRWQKEYLVNLREFHRVTGDNREIAKPGSVVIIHDDNVPRLKWKLGIIEHLHKSTDGLVRSATVKTANGVTNRPISKLFPLEIESNVLKPSVVTTKEIPDRIPSTRKAALEAKDKIDELFKN
ncbi:uncharacterized protein LOC141910517 [Tubulanus polymorphus]|uniref:uncharacterized protein LOC141910517 n=1 Tax=Tubulanus polymorphus TaxID=672921 RepID=UPI003DA5DAFA